MLREAGDLEKIKVPKGVDQRFTRGPAKQMNMKAFKANMAKFKRMKLGN